MSKENEALFAAKLIPLLSNTAREPGWVVEPFPKKASLFNVVSATASNAPLPVVLNPNVLAVFESVLVKETCDSAPYLFDVIEKFLSVAL